MRPHTFTPSPDGRKAMCSRCGLRVSYIEGHRSTMMDWMVVERAERTVIVMSGFRARPGRPFGDCDRMMEVAVRVVMRD